MAMLTASVRESDAGLVGIIGMACRVPGAKSVHEFWQLMNEPRDLRKKMPANRFNVDGFYHPDGKNKGTLNAPYGYFLDQNLGDFDAGFFGISPKEAEAMDPQQRLALEVVYEALEDAGIPFSQIAGSRTSVYCGSFTNDYGKLIDRDMASYPTYTVTGTGQTILSNRISYFYDLHGESMTVDTACSSSLICLHQASQSLRSGQSDMAIVVGSALHFDPNMFVTMADFGMLSPDGRSRSFDANGKGYARGEGTCVIIMKRLRDAEESNDRIHAVVRATGANHDGTKNGITLPNPVAQEALMRDVYSKAGISTKDTAYFEAHGTGTKAGDPREARAIGAVFAKDGRSEPLYIGSVKSVIGHLEGAAGLAAVIKATLSVKNGQILPNMHFKQPNPEIDFENWNLRVPTQVIGWPADHRWRRASINSFGYGGSNCHVVVEAYRTQINALSSHTTSNRRYLLPISAHSEKVAEKAAMALRDYLIQHPDVSMPDLAYTLSHLRAHHEKRSFVSAISAEEAVSALADAENPLFWNTTKRIRRLGFVFTGQGAQWVRMGASLLDSSVIFRKVIEKYDEILQSLPDCPDWSAIDELQKSKEESRINKPQFSQPVCTAVQLGILAQLHEWGIKPVATVGHSSGEVAAAYAAGLVSFPTAVAISYYRGRYTSKDASNTSQVPGGMLAVGMTEAEAQKTLEHYVGRICVAAVNSPSSLTLSGDLDAITELKENLMQQKIFARSLVVEQAYHSHHMIPFADCYRQAMEGFAEVGPAQPDAVSMISSVTGRRLHDRAVGPQYWVDNLVSPVRFFDAVTETVFDEADHVQIDAFVEIGPHPALKGPVRQTLASLNLEIPHVGTLARGVDDFQSLLTTAGQLLSLGYPVDLKKVNGFDTCPAQRVEDLPTYCWDHVQYWAQSRLATAYLQREYRHPLLGVPQPDCTRHTKRWRNYLRLREIPWLAGHKVQDRVIFPAAGYLSLAAEAASRVKEARSVGFLRFREVHIKSALELLDSETGTEIIFELRRLDSNGEWQFQLHSFDIQGDSREHCRGIVFIDDQNTSGTLPNVRKLANVTADWDIAISRAATEERFYHKLHALGLEYDGPFKLIKGMVESQAGFATAPIAPPTQESGDDCLLDPGFLDASLHPIFAAVEAELGRPITQPFLPVYVNSLDISGLLLQKPSPQDMKVFARVKRASGRSLMASVHVYESPERPLVALDGLELRALGGDMSSESRRSLFQNIRWLPCFDLLGLGRHTADHLARHSMESILDMFAHQHPDASILYITADAGSALQQLADGAGLLGRTRRRYKEITICLSSATAVEELEAFKSQETWASVSVQSEIPAQKSFDFIISRTQMTLSPELVNTNGFVLSEVGIAMESNEMVKRFQHGHIECWQKLSSSEPNGVVNSIAVVTTSAPSPRTMQLIRLLEEKGSPAMRVTFDQLDPVKLQDMPETLIVLETLDECFLHQMDADDSAYFDGMKELLSAHSKHIIWVLEESSFEPTNPRHAMIYGMLRVARSENELSRIVCLDVSSSSQAPQIFHAMEPLLNLQATAEDEIAERNGVHYIPRLEMDDALNGKLFNGHGRTPFHGPFTQDQVLQLRSAAGGYHRGFLFEQVSMPALGDDELEIEVKATKVTQRDALLAQENSLDARYGADCAGIILQKGKNISDEEFRLGDRVVVIRPPTGSLRNRLPVQASSCRRLRDDEPFHLAALWPSPVAMAYYALVHLAHLVRGETVLVFSAESQTGQAILQLAKHLGATVLAIANSANGKASLLETWPDLTVLTLDEAMKSGLENIGRVDVVLSNHAVNSRWCHVQSLKSCGRLIDYSDVEAITIHAGEGVVADEMPIHSELCARVDLDCLLKHRPALISEVLEVAHNLIHEGVVKLGCKGPTVFSFAQTDHAFDHLASTQNTAPIIIAAEDDCQVPISPSSFGSTQFIFSPDKVYLLVGGLSGLGLELAEWMVVRGARHIAFMSRSGAQSATATAMLARLAAKGAQTTVHRCDVTDLAAVEQCITQIRPRLGGILHAAAVIDDCPLQQMSVSQWRRTIAPKVYGVEILDRVTAGMDLEFFICFSSASAIVGTKAQASYVAGNAYMDALMRSRRQRGLSGTTINIGMVVGIGLVSADAKLEATMKRTGFDPVNEYEFFCLVEEAVLTGRSLTTSDDRNTERYRIVTGTRVTGPQCFWYKKPLFRQLAAIFDGEEDSPDASGGKKMDLIPLLRAASNDTERCGRVIPAFLETLSRITGLNVSALDPSKALVSYGLDSLVAMEIRNWFLKTLQVNVAVFEILGSESITGLVSRVVKDIPESLLHAEGHSGAATIASVKVQLQRTSIDKLPRPEHIPMSSFQTRFWFMHQMADHKSALNVSVTLYLRGEIDLSALSTALSLIRQQNEVLQSAFVMTHDSPEQVVLRKDRYDISTEDLSSAENPDRAVSDRILQLRGQELDIESGETVSISLLKIASDRYALALLVHHIVTDRGSSKAFLDQLVMFYDDIVAGKSGDVVQMNQRTQYIDFTLWHERHLRSPEMRPHVEYWIDTFKEAPPVSALLPFARPRPQTQSFKTSSLSANLPATLFARMKRIAARFNSTVPQFIMAAFRLIHYRYTQQEDLTIHLVNGDRPHPDVQDMLGNYVNLLPIRHRLEEPDITFDALLRQLQHRVLEAMEHGEIPFDMIVREVAVPRFRSHFPLGQLAFNYQSHGPMKNYSTRHFDIEKYETIDIPTACDMSLEAIEDAQGGVKLVLEYSQALYDNDDMDRFLENFLTCLSATVKDYRQPIKEVPICGSKELALLEKCSSQPVSDYDSRMDIAQIISLQAVTYPSSIALVDSDGQRMTYSELVDAARKVAATIQTCGVQPGDVVGLLATPSVDLLVGLMGIVFSRCAFVALDPDFPKERLQYMATDSGCALIVTDLKASGQGGKFSQRLINIRAATCQPRVQSFQLATFESNQPFYVTYTSGSTGKPKGVIMRHRNAQPMLEDIQDKFRFDSSENFLLATSICFDLSVLQIFTPLLVGATVNISSAATRRDPLLLSQFMKQSSVTFTYFTPSQFAVLFEGAEDELRECSTWRTAMFCGEVLHPRLARQLYSLQTPAVIYNAYGPCEAMVQITLQRVDKPVLEDRPISIGQPLKHSWCYVVDAGLHPVPVGVIGELCVAGPQVGESYLHRPKESRMAFHLDPFLHDSLGQQASHMFRTGDMARLNHDGTFDYVGRMAGTTLVKLRGYRLDLLEIEQNILIQANDAGMKDIAAACVVARTLKASAAGHALADERQLIAFLVLRDSSSSQATEIVSRLHRGLSARLPHFMLPGGYHVLPSLPQTIGGKTDRQVLLNMSLKLIHPHRQQVGEKERESENAISATSVYDWVDQLFRSTLNLGPTNLLDPETSFFELGGHSVLLLTVQSSINRKFMVKIPLKDILDRPTPGGMMEHICTLKGIPFEAPCESSSSAGTTRPTTPSAMSNENECAIRIASGSTSPGHLTPPLEVIKDGEKMLDLSVTKATFQLNWDEETLLPVEDRYHIPAGGEYPAGQRTADIFITGVDTFVGIHFLAEVLACSSVTVHIIGTSRRISHVNVIDHLEKYGLLRDSVSPGTVWARVRCYHGDMTQPHFGLTPSEFERLGHRVQVIYNLGVYVSLIQKYSNLRSVNTRAILDIIELAACGHHVSTIHHLSTFSVPHLQSWSQSVRMHEGSYSSTEKAPVDYRPSTDDDFGYIKARWAAEMLLTNAADRGFPIRVYRASMPTASTQTGIPPAEHGVIERIVTLMLRTGYVPKPQPGQPDMAVDLVPVNVLVSWLYLLSAMPTETDRLRIHHLINPHPLPFTQLVELIPGLANGPGRGALLDLEPWLERVGKVCGNSEGEQLMWVATTNLLRVGHVMFQLDGQRTQSVLKRILGAPECPAVDASYLDQLLNAREI